MSDKTWQTYLVTLPDRFCFVGNRQIAKTRVLGHSGSRRYTFDGMTDKPDILTPKQEQMVEAERLYRSGLTYEEVAKRVGKSTRTIERWGAAGEWAKQPIQEELADSISNVVEIGDRRPVRKRKRLDEQEIIEEAIESLSSLLKKDHVSINSPGVGSAASALVRLLEYRRKICPPTVVDLAEAAIALGVTPQEFMAELERQWQLRA